MRGTERDRQTDKHHWKLNLKTITERLILYESNNKIGHSRAENYPARISQLGVGKKVGCIPFFLFPSSTPSLANSYSPVVPLNRVGWFKSMRFKSTVFAQQEYKRKQQKHGGHAVYVIEQTDQF